MSEENINNEMPGQGNQESTTGSSTHAASGSVEGGWQEVGRQFQALGASLAQAFRAAWEDENTQKQVQDMRAGLESMVKDVSKAIEDSANTPQGKQIREDATKAVEAIQNAGKQTVHEIRPHLITTLQQLNEEIQKLISRMEAREKSAPQAPEQPKEE